jgi:choline dehydrogenase
MHPLVDQLIEAGARSGYRPNDDFNGASQMGVGRFQLTQRNGLRCSAASAYLHPARERANLHVFTMPSYCSCCGRVSARPASRFIVTVGRKRYLLKEKSSSRPAYGSPQILMLSGLYFAPPGHPRGVIMFHFLNHRNVGSNQFEKLGKQV